MQNPALPTSTDQIISTNGRKAERLLHILEPLDKELVDLLTASCSNSHNERCGFVTGDEDIFYVDNIHAEPTHNFLMCPNDFQSVVTEIYDIRDTRIVGMFHTHPNNVPWPTPRDLVGWPNPALRWRYWIVTASDVIEWRLIGG